MSKKSDPTHPALQPLHPDLFVKVEYVPVGGLTPYQGNPRTHSKRQIEQIMHSIAFFGFASPLVANAAGVLIQGEGRRRAAPKYTQFKPARSGNPGGRKKGSRNFSTLLKEAAQSTILVNDSGRFREVAMVEAVVLRGLQMGLGGNTRAMAIMLQQFERHLVNAEDNGTELPEEDQASWSGASLMTGSGRWARTTQPTPPNSSSWPSLPPTP